MEDYKMSEFRKELSGVLNKYSKETASDTPDFILAEYLEMCLENFDTTIKGRKNWYKGENK
jgi:hypothetical protein